MVAMYESLGTQWAGSLLGFISIGLLPIPILLFRFVRCGCFADLGLGEEFVRGGPLEVTRVDLGSGKFRMTGQLHRPRRYRHIESHLVDIIETDDVTTLLNGRIVPGLSQTRGDITKVH
jgi:hypothetical protein